MKYNETSDDPLAQLLQLKELKKGRAKRWQNLEHPRNLHERSQPQANAMQFALD